MITSRASLLIKNIRHLVTCDKGDRVLENVDLYVEDGVIRQIGGETPQARTVLDAGNMAAFPGLVNTHHHLYQILTRNLPWVQNLELFDWLRALYEIWQYLDADAVYASSMAGIGELLLGGCTTVFDHHYVFPRGAGDLLEAQFAAAQTLGARMAASRGSMSLSRKDGGLPPDSVVQTLDEILKDSQDAVERFHDPAPGSMRQVALAPCSPFSATAELMRESAVLARKLGVRLHTHLAETRDEEAYVLEKTGMRPLAYMESLGWIGSDVWYAHGIQFNDDELRHLAKTGTGVAHCPASNMKLSSGICRVPEMIDLKVPVGLAVDGSASNDGSNLCGELRIAYLLHRLQSSEKAVSGYELLKAATVGGARLLGRGDIGYLAEGMSADIFLVREDRLELAGACFDVQNMLATVGLNGPVDYTVVNGKIVVRNGALCHADARALSRSATAAAEKMLAKSRS